MKLCFKFTLIFVLNFVANYGQRVSLIGSYFVPTDQSNYKAVLLAQDLNPPNVDVGLSSAGSPNALKSFNSPFNNIELKPPRSGNNNYELQVSTRSCKAQPIKLSAASDRSIIFINFATPVFKTGDTFKFQIFVMDQNLKPRQNFKDITAVVRDSEGHVIKYFGDLTTSNFGVFETFFKIADSPNLGIWTLEVNGAGRKVTKHFHVLKPENNGMELFVEVPSVVAFDDKKIFMNLYVKDKLDRLFHGTANIRVSAWFKGSNKIEINEHAKTVNITGNKNGVILDIQDDLGIRYPNQDMIIKFDVEVTNHLTQSSVKVSKETEMRHKGKHLFEIVRKKFFKPGFKYPVRIRVKHINGHTDNSFNQLSLNVKYAASKTKIEEKSFQINLKNGETVAQLQPAADTKQILISIEFARTEQTEKIDRFPSFGANEYMLVTTVTKNPSIGQQVQFHAQTTGEMETLHVLVVGTFGIVHSDEFKDAVQKDVYDFSITLTEEMRPEARGIAFYVRPQDGVIVFDEFSLSPGVSVDNSLEITTSPENIKPGEIANFDIKTEVGSQVYLTAVDHNPFSSVRSNEISRSDVYNELVHYLNLKYPSTSGYHLEKFNAFIYEPIVKGQCNKNSTSFEPFEAENLKIDSWPGNYFPSVWIDDAYEAKHAVETTKKESPKSFTSWRAFGVSVHPEKGFSVAKVQPKVFAKNDIAAQIKAPTSVFSDEAFTVEVNGYNFLKEELRNAQVRVTIDGATSVRERVKDSKRVGRNTIECLEYKPERKVDSQFRKNLPVETMTNLEQFLIQSVGSGDIMITVTIQAGNYADKVTKVVIVVNSNKKSDFPISSSLITLSKSKRTEEVKGLENIQSIGYATVYGNLLGPALNGLETMFDKPLTTDEEKVLKFATAIINHQFVNSINHNNDQRAEKAYDDIETGYQEAIAILDKILNTQDTKSIWLAAFAVQTILDVSKIVVIDQDLITRSLDFIKTQQQTDGSFKYDESSDYHRDIGSKFRKEVQTALIIPAFFKNKDKYSNNIQKTMTYLNRQTGWRDHVKSVVAYTFALNGDLDAADKILESTTGEFSDNTAHLSTYVEITSFEILTKVLLNQDPQEQVDWLLSQRHADGSFYSPYDTVLALKALFEYSKFKNLHQQTTNLQFKLQQRAAGSPVTNQLGSETVQIKNKNQKLELTGQGVAYVSVFEKMEEEPIDAVEYFDTKLTKRELTDNKAELVISVKASKASSLFVVEVELPRGYKYNGPEGDVNSAEIYQIYNDYDNNRVIFYIKKLEANREFKLQVETTKIFDFKTQNPSTIKAYDYYRSNLKDIIYYSFDKVRDNCEQIEKVNSVETLNKELQTLENEESEIYSEQNELEAIERKITAVNAGIKTAFDDINKMNNEIQSVELGNEEVLTSIDAGLNQAKNFDDTLSAPINDQSEEEPINVDDNFENSQQVSEEIKMFTNDFQGVYQEIEAAENNSRKFTIAVKNIKNYLEAYTLASANLKIEAEKLKTKLEQFQNLPAMKTSILNLENQVNDLDSKIKGCLFDLKTVSNSFGGIKNQISNTKREATALKLNQLKDKIAAIQEQVQEMKQTVETIKQNSNSYKVSYNKLKPETAVITAVKDEAEDFAQLKRDLYTLKRKATEEQSKLERVKPAAVQSTRLGLENSQKQIKKLNQKKAKIDNIITNLTQKLINLQNAEEDEKRRIEIEATSTTRSSVLPSSEVVEETTKYIGWKNLDDFEGKTNPGVQTATQSTQVQSTAQPTIIYTTTHRPTTKPPLYETSTQEQTTGTPSGQDSENCHKWYRFCNFGL